MEDMNEYTKQVLHLTRMAMLPGFLGQSRLRCRELAQEPMFKGIGQEVANELERLGWSAPDARIAEES